MSIKYQHIMSTYKQNLMDRFPPVSNEWLNKLIPVIVDKKLNVWEIEKPSSLHSVAYTWEINPKRYMGFITKNSIDVSVFSNEQSFKNTYGDITILLKGYEYITFHTCVHMTYFKPSLYEVGIQLEKQLFEDFDQIYVTTDRWISGESNYNNTINDLHIGRSLVFVPQDKRQLESSDYPKYMQHLLPK